MILPIKRIPDGHSALSQKVEFSGDQAQWLAANDLSCRAEIDRIGSQLHVHLFYAGSVRTECARCLKPVDFPAQGDFRVMCVHRSDTGEGRDFREGEPDFVYDDDTDVIDLTQLLYEEIMVALPMKPLCSEQCPGMVFGKTKDRKTGAAARHETIDPRWESLKKLKNKN